jgi:hypothetical protein
MTKLTYLLLAAALGSTALSAQSNSPAGPQDGGARHRGRGPIDPVAQAIDTDKNGELSPAEIANAPIMIDALDLDGDGTVSFTELRPVRPVNLPTPPAEGSGRDRATRGLPLATVMFALDANGDGEVSTAEIANATRSLTALDLNKYG